MSGPQYGFGSGVLYGIRNDIAGQTPVRFGVLQDVSIEFSSDVKDLFGQNQFPVDSARGKAKIMGKAKQALLSPLLYNSIFFGQTLQAGQSLAAYSETATVGSVVTGTTNATTALGNNTLHFASTPSGVVVGASVTDTTAAVIPAGTYVLSKTSTTVVMSANATGAGVGSGDSISFGPSATAANAADFSQDLGVLYASTGQPLILVTGAPAVGEYTVTAAGVYSFNSSEAAAAVLLNYLYDTTSGSTLVGNNPLMGNTPKFMAVFTMEYGGNTMVLTLFSCVAGKLSFPTKLDDYMIQDFDFQAHANAANQVFTLGLSETYPT